MNGRRLPTRATADFATIMPTRRKNRTILPNHKLTMKLSEDRSSRLDSIDLLRGLVMVVMAMAGLIFLPMTAIVAFGVALIGLHNSFDGVSAAQFGEYAWIWKILHTGESFKISSDFLNLRECVFLPFYPLIPWIGVMAV